MHLPAADIELFYKLWFALLAYASQRYPAILPGAKTQYEIRQTPLGTLKPLRDMVYEHPEVFDAFVTENPYGFTDDEVAIVRGWRNFVRGQFILLRQLKAYTIFLDINEPPKAYGVLALVSPFEEMAELPVMIETALLPFKGKITYDGIMLHSSVWFGRGIRESFNDTYQRAKSKYGIITSLPYTPPSEEQSDEELLRFYLKSERNREEYWGEIQELLRTTPSLLPVYHQELGKQHARAYKRRFREQGLAPAWFAILDELLIASGKTRDEVNDIIAWLVPAEKRDFVYVYQWKP